MLSLPFKAWVAKSYSGEDSEARWLPQPQPHEANTDPSPSLLRCASRAASSERGAGFPQAATLAASHGTERQPLPRGARSSPACFGQADGQGARGSGSSWSGGKARSQPGSWQRRRLTGLRWESTRERGAP